MTRFFNQNNKADFSNDLSVMPEVIESSLKSKDSWASAGKSKLVSRVAASGGARKGKVPFVKVSSKSTSSKCGRQVTFFVEFLWLKEVANTSSFLDIKLRISLMR